MMPGLETPNIFFTRHMCNEVELLKEAEETLKAVGAQGTNSKSSRSHAIVQIMVAANDFITTEIIRPNANFLLVL